MTIQPIFEKGAGRARVTCDECNREETIACDYERRRGQARGVPNEGQVIRKLQGSGWALIKGRNVCPACEAKRKAEAATQKQEAVMAKEATVTELRQPTREQKRQIMAMLEAAYDTKAGRYTGGETDKTVADAIGGGVMFGWVADIREEFFGADGGNGDMTEVLAEFKAAQEALARLHAENEAASKTVIRIETEMKQHKERINRAIARVEAIKAAVGPKAARA